MPIETTKEHSHGWSRNSLRKRYIHRNASLPSSIQLNILSLINKLRQFLKITLKNPRIIFGCSLLDEVATGSKSEDSRTS